MAHSDVSEARPAKCRKLSSNAIWKAYNASSNELNRMDHEIDNLLALFHAVGRNQERVPISRVKSTLGHDLHDRAEAITIAKQGPFVVLFGPHSCSSGCTRILEAENMRGAVPMRKLKLIVESFLSATTVTEFLTLKAQYADRRDQIQILIDMLTLSVELSRKLISPYMAEDGGAGGTDDGDDGHDGGAGGGAGGGDGRDGANGGTGGSKVGGSKNAGGSRCATAAAAA